MQQPQHALASTPQLQQNLLQGATPTERNHHKEQVIAWLRDTFYVGESGSIAKGSVYKEYQQLCERHRWTALSSPALGKIVHKAFPDLKGVRKGVRGKAVYHYKNLNYIHSQIQREHQPLPQLPAPPHHPQQQGIRHTHQIQPLPPYPQQPQQPQLHLKPQPQSPPHRLLPLSPIHSPPKRLPFERREPEDFSQGQHGPVKSFLGERRQAAHSALWDTEEMKQITQNYYLRNTNENNHKNNDNTPDPYDEFANDSGLFNINDGGQMLQSLLNALDIRIRKSFSSSSSSFSEFASALSDPTLNLTFSVPPTPPLTTTTTTTSTTTATTVSLPQTTLATPTTTKTFEMQLEEEQLKNCIMGLFSRILLALIRSFQVPDWRTGQANRESDLRKIIREFWMNEEMRVFIPNQADMILFFLNCGTLFLLDEVTNETEIMPPDIRPAFLKCVALDLPCWANGEVSSRPEISKMGNFKENHHRIWINFSKELEKRFGLSTDEGQGFESL